MNISAKSSERIRHIKATLQNDVIFHKDAVEISVLNRWGRAIWSKKRGESLEPISWNGIDSYGCKATDGSYLCKIVYPEKLIVYVPFVFIQK